MSSRYYDPRYGLLEWEGALRDVGVGESGYSKIGDLDIMASTNDRKRFNKIHGASDILKDIFTYMVENCFFRSLDRATQAWDIQHAKRIMLCEGLDRTPDWGVEMGDHYLLCSGPLDIYNYTRAIVRHANAADMNDLGKDGDHVSFTLRKSIYS